jgi:predicted Zn-dependent protease
MKSEVLKRAAVFMLALTLGLPATLFAEEKKPSDDKKAADSTQPVPKGKLSDDEDPTMIGKRKINKSVLPNFYSLDREVALGRQLAEEVNRQAKFIDDPIVTEYVNRIGQNIVLHSDAKVPFTIRVLDSDDVNAFALPGGFFYVNKGLILAADNEAEVAGVMAHEIAHVAARHGTEQASKAQLANFAMIPLIFVTGGLGALAYNGVNILVPLAFLKFTRSAEGEADKLGAQYAWAAGYDPNSLVTFFEKLEKKEKTKPGTLSKLFGTHPPTPDRITKVRELLTRFPDRDEYTVNTSEFNRVKNRLLALTNARSIDPANRTSGPTRPTLKRRKEGDDQTTQPSEEAPKEKPTLKRRDSDGKPADTKPAETKPPETKP